MPNIKEKNDYINEHPELYAGYEKWYAKGDLLCHAYFSQNTGEGQLIFEFIPAEEFIEGYELFLSNDKTYSIEEFNEHLDDSATRKIVDLDSADFLSFAKEFVEVKTDWVIAETTIPVRPENKKEYVLESLYKYLCRQGIQSDPQAINNIARKILSSKEVRDYVRSELERKMRQEKLSRKKIIKRCEKSPLELLRDLLLNNVGI